MAKLIGIAKGDWEFNSEDIEESIKRQDRLFKELESKRREDSVIGSIISFPVADGFAHYFVEKEKPLSLSLIPYGDAYQIPEAHIRGLTLKDVKTMVQRQRKIKKMFGV